MGIKNWFGSKTNWLGMMTVAGSIIEFIFGQPAGTSIAQLIVGIMILICRAYTNTAITGTPGAKPKK